MAEPGAKVGAAYVEIRPDDKNFGRDLRRGLQRETAGVDIGVPVHADARGLRAEVTAEARRAGAGQDIGLRLTVDRNGVARLRDANGQFVAMGGSARQAERGVSSFDRSLRRLGTSSREVRRIGRDLTDAGRRGTIAGVGLAAVGSGYGIIAAAGPAALGVLAATPGLVIGVAQAVGALGLGLSGVGAAVQALADEQASAGDDAAASALQQSTAAEQVRSAQERVRDATISLGDRQRDARRAQQDLTDARRDARQRLQDLRFEVQGLALDERDASISLQEAQERLTETLSDPRASQLERDRAQLAVEQAERRVEEVARRNKELREEESAAARAGVEGDTQVVAAKERVADAQRAVTEAARDVRQAQQDVARVAADTSVRLGQLSTSGRKVRDTFSELSPEGQRFARFLFSLDPVLERLQRASGRDLLPGLEQGIRFGLRALPEFETMLERTGGALGNVAEDAGRLIGSGPFRRDFATLARNNAETIEQLGGAGVRLLGTFVQLGAEADPLVDTVTNLADRWTRNLDATVRNTAATGELNEFFEEAADTLEQVFDIGGDVLGIVGDLGRASFPAGQGLLGSLEELVDNLHEVTSSAQGQEQLRAFFDDLALVIQHVAEGTGLAAQVVGPLVRDLTAFAAEHPNLTRAAAAIALIAATGNAVGVGSLISGFGRTITVVRNVRRAYDAYKAAKLAHIGVDAAVGAAERTLAGTTTVTGAAASASALKWGLLAAALGKVVLGAGLAIAAQQGLEELTGADERRRGLDPQEFRLFEVLQANEAAGALTEKGAKELERLRAKIGEVTAATRELGVARQQLTEKDRLAAVGIQELQAQQRYAAMAARDLGISQEEAATRMEEVNGRVRDAIPLFGGYRREQEVTSKQILGNLKQEVQAYTDWERNVRTLLKRGVDPEIVRQLSEKGPGYVAAFVNSSDRELRQLERLMGQRTGAARKTAQTEFDKLTAGANRALGGIRDEKVVISAVARLFEEGVAASDAAKARHLIGLAEGGPVHGPGTSTSDSVLIRASDNEFMQPAASHEYYGTAFMEALQHRRIPREALPGFAAGGPIRGYARGGAILPQVASSGQSQMLSGVRRQVQFVEDYARIATAFNLVRRADEARARHYNDGKWGSGSWQRLTAFLNAADVPFQIISTYREGARTAGTGAVSYHARNRAVDLRGPSKLDIWNALRGFPGLPTELIYSPAPYQIYTGGRIHRGPPSNPRTRRDHYDHVHAALAKGTPFVPATGLYQLHRGERVVPADQNAALTAGLGGVTFGPGSVVVHVNGAGMSAAEIRSEVQQGVSDGIAEAFGEARRELVQTGGRGRA